MKETYLKISYVKCRLICSNPNVLIDTWRNLQAALRVLRVGWLRIMSYNSISRGIVLLLYVFKNGIIIGFVKSLCDGYCVTLKALYVYISWKWIQLLFWL